MNKAGLYAQSGFEYQKLVFTFFSLKMGHYNEVTYESCDDVEISNSYFPLFSIIDNTQPNTLIQVKSGDVDKETLKRVFVNWLLVFDPNKKFTLFLENPLVINYKEESFLDELINDVLTTKASCKSIIRQAKNKFENATKTLQDNLKEIIEKFVIENYSIDQVKEESFSLFKTFYSPDDNEILNQERFEDYLRLIRSEIADKILERRPFVLTWRNLFNLIEDVRSRINADQYDISYTEFKASSDQKVDKLLSKNGDSVKQLKLITSDPSKILDFLTEQVFYEDFKSHFDSIEKTKEINDLEFLAFANYNDVMFELESEHASPKTIFIKTTNKELKSALFKSNSSSINFYSRGCYIHLTDNDVPDEIKIKWGDVHED
ncbi:MAG: hypothetical protein IJQ07_06545 [Clostridia bacterium]|nr:hypothetical protein [Clostridia bacterium]